MAKVVNLQTNAVPLGTSFPPVVLDGNYIAAGSTKTLTVADNHAIVKLDTLTGSVVTLPAATGCGAKFKFIVTVLATSNSHKIQVANASDTMIGVVFEEDTDSSNAVLGFAAGATSDTITLNRTTTGSVSKGEWVTVEDVAANVWLVRGFTTVSGSPATPFSAAV